MKKLLSIITLTIASSAYAGDWQYDFYRQAEINRQQEAEWQRQFDERRQEMENERRFNELEDQYQRQRDILDDINRRFDRSFDFE